jgi:hypothetical protein
MRSEVEWKTSRGNLQDLESRKREFRTEPIPEALQLALFYVHDAKPTLQTESAKILSRSSQAPCKRATTLFRGIWFLYREACGCSNQSHPHARHLISAIPTIIVCIGALAYGGALSSMGVFGHPFIIIDLN